MVEPLNPTRHTAEVSRKVARVAVADAVSRLSHLEDVLIWDSAFDANQWDACETLLVEALTEIRKGRTAHNLVAAANAARDKATEEAVILKLDRMGMSETAQHLQGAAPEGLNPVIQSLVKFFWGHR